MEEEDVDEGLELGREVWKVVEGGEGHGETVAGALVMEAETTAYDCAVMVMMMAKEDA